MQIVKKLINILRQLNYQNSYYLVYDSKVNLASKLTNDFLNIELQAQVKSHLEKKCFITVYTQTNVEYIREQLVYLAFH